MLSIITPCLNRARLVVEAVESVRRQDYADVEHVIMDGASTDGTLEALKQYPSLRVYSQPDRGIYDALNLGLGLARGEVIGFLNTDDLYEPGVFGRVMDVFERDEEVEALAGGACIFRDGPGGDQTTVMQFPCVAPGQLLERATQGAPIFNAWFFRKRLLDELHGFETQYLYVADRDLLIRMALIKKCYYSLGLPVYRYRMHAGSFTLSGQDAGEADYMFETRALAERYLRRGGIPREQLAQFRAWHSEITIEQMQSAWRAKATGRMVGYLLNGCRYNRRWPMIFARKVIERLPYILGQKTEP